MSKSSVIADFISNIEKYKNCLHGEVIMNDDMTISVKGSVVFDHEIFSNLPLRFKRVDSDFIIKNSYISTLEGVPEYVGGEFKISDCKGLDGLDFVPKFIGYRICLDEEMAGYCNLQKLADVENVDGLTLLISARMGWLSGYRFKTLRKKKGWIDYE